MGWRMFRAGRRRKARCHICIYLHKICRPARLAFSIDRYALVEKCTWPTSLLMLGMDVVDAVKVVILPPALACAAHAPAPRSRMCRGCLEEAGTTPPSLGRSIAVSSLLPLLAAAGPSIDPMAPSVSIFNMSLITHTVRLPCHKRVE